MSFTTVITTYNRELQLPKAIRSALSECASGEIIVVDDASTDNTLAVIKQCFSLEIMSGKIRIVSNMKNMGVSGAKNEGYKVAQFDWVVFLDSDDWYTDGAGVAMAKELSQNCQRPIVFFRCIDQSGNFVGKSFPYGVELDLVTYIHNTSFGEALTAVNKAVIGITLPYIPELRGYEGLGCSRLISRFGSALLSNTVARVYDNSYDNRLSVSSGKLLRWPLLAKGHLMMLREFGSKMYYKRRLALIVKVSVYIPIGLTYRFYKSLFK